MKQELTPEAKRIVINWLKAGYYDTEDLQRANNKDLSPDSLSIQEMNDEIVRLLKGETEILAKAMRASGFCRECNKINNYLYGKESKNII